MRSPPAAHSMDTTWFAVDADGNVAVFDTGEDGALPEKAATGGGMAEPSFDTFFFQAARLGADLRALAEPMPLEARASSRAQRVVIVLSEPQAVDGPATHRTTATPERFETTFSATPWRVVREEDPRVLASEKPIEAEALDAIARRPDVLHLVGEDELYELLLEDVAVFHYEHDDSDGYQPGQYRRAPRSDGAPPSKPLALGDLSTSDQDEIGRLVLPVRFAEAETIHLADHMTDADCQTWAEVSLRGEPKAETKPTNGGAPAKGSAPRAIALVLLVAIVALVWWFSR